MLGKRSYDDPCGVARALDLVGERWALLVVRELLFGPKRFADLSRGLPGMSQNVLSQRLSELEQAGIARRRRLGPPASTRVYELTERGAELEPILDALARWGSRVPLAATTELSVDAFILALKTTFDPVAAAGLHARYELASATTASTPRLVRVLSWSPAGLMRPPTPSSKATLQPCAPSSSALAHSPTPCAPAISTSKAIKRPPPVSSPAFRAPSPPERLHPRIKHSYSRSNIFERTRNGPPGVGGPPAFRSASGNEWPDLPVQRHRTPPSHTKMHRRDAVTTPQAVSRDAVGRRPQGVPGQREGIHPRTRRPECAPPGATDGQDRNGLRLRECAGPLHLLDLFDGRRQLIVYHFMFDPDWDEGCPMCSFLTDNIPNLAHLRDARDTSLVLVSRAPLAKITPFKQRMGWTFPGSLRSAAHSTTTSTSRWTKRSHPVELNYRDKTALQQAGMTSLPKGEQPGLSVFLRDGDSIFHTYSSYARGLDMLDGTYNYLDLTPLGRQEEGPGSHEFQHHDTYGT